jgi:hypothetical protein
MVFLKRPKSAKTKERILTVNVIVVKANHRSVTKRAYLLIKYRKFGELRTVT